MPPAEEELPARQEGRLPVLWFGFYDHVLVRERATGEWAFEALWTHERDGELERRFAELVRRAEAVPASAAYELSPFRLIPGADGHREAVRTAVEYIHRGDIFQANICLRAEAAFAGDPLDAFCQSAGDLRPPYASFVGVSAPDDTLSAGQSAGAGRAAVASLSPELFLRRMAGAGGTVVSKPIKGTAPRSGNVAEAAAQRARLAASAKNRAENVMIVDLVRNDLARVCEPGSVAVPVLLGAEPHPGVWHLVSTVEGKLAAGRSDGDLIRAAFPPGSVTGAPKVRALEIIDELEAAAREAYTGAIGYRSPIAGLELNVAIRTFEFAAGRVWLGAGGGIVADSAPDDEYAEAILKATPLLAAIGASLDTSPGSPDTSAAGPARPSRGDRHAGRDRATRPASPPHSRSLHVPKSHRRQDKRPGSAPCPPSGERPSPLRQAPPNVPARHSARAPSGPPDRPPPHRGPPDGRPAAGHGRGGPPDTPAANRARAGRGHAGTSHATPGGHTRRNW